MRGKVLVRVGEATNPGPERQAERAAWGAFGAQLPWRGGFRDAVAPGFEASSPAEDKQAGGDEDGKSPYVLRILTINVSSWGSLVPFLRDTTADVLLVQEHKLFAEKADERAAWLRRRGWNALMTAAEPGANGGPSAGAAVLARAHVGMGLPLVGSEEVVPARAVAARLEPPGGRPFTAVAAYCHDGAGLGRANLDLLRSIGRFVTAQGGDEHEPFVIGADFQVTPQELAVAGYAQEIGGVIMSSGDPSGTCRTPTSAREIDFFIMSPSLAAGVEEVSAVRGSGMRTHLPVELRFAPRLASLRALVLRKPPPPPPPFDGEDCRALEASRPVGAFRRQGETAGL